MNINHLCMNCMKEKPNTAGKCVYCGFDETASQNEPNQLELWTVLRGSYVVGKALGEGGFGITYVGMDLNLQIKVAIKEFFPYGYAVRRGKGDKMVCHFEGEKGQFFLQEKAKFIEEARTLAQLDEQPGVVKVRDYFEENGTAYIVMEFLEGMTLKEYIAQKGGKLMPEEVLSLMNPVIKSLAGVHDKNVIHRDISPDNIMISNSGKVKLIDFGAAIRRKNADDNVILYKEGFSPLEQVTGEGELGTYSDIYALCATMYYAMTGKLPVSPLSRQREDTLQTLSQMGVHVKPLVEAALMYGMELEANERIKNATDLYYFLYLYGEQANASRTDMKKKIKQSSTHVIAEKIRKENQRKKTQLYITIAAVAVLVIGIVFLSLIQHVRIANNSKTPVVTNTIVADDKKAAREVSADTLNELKGQFYDALDAYRSEKGGNAVVHNSRYEAMAAEYVNKCVTADYSSTEEWNQGLVSFAEEILAAQETEGIGWLVLPYAQDHSIEQVLRDAEANINANSAGVEDSSNLLSCMALGIGVGVHGDGTYFWAIFYK